MGFFSPSRYFRLFPEEITITSLSTGKASRAALGHKVDPTRPNYKLAKYWLKICQEKHGPKCSGTQSVYHGALRLIDCERRIIFEANEHVPYVCLSYLWGSEVDNAVTTTTTLPDNVPKVVEDAVTVALELGIPFLWVDRYCIDQENQHEKHNIIRQMDKIFSRAELTIIAAAGNSPHYGLPGIRGTPRDSQYRLRVGSHQFHEVQEVKDEIKNSKWNTRGWTYQEMALSSRRLVFTHSQMYFQCQQTYALESICPSLLPKIKGLRGVHEALPAGGIGGAFQDISQCLMEYYKRQLSFKSDIIDAFTGIISAFDRSPLLDVSVTHFYGMPILHHQKDIDRTRNSLIGNLDWKVTSFDTRPTNSTTPNLFPSWSWASVKALHPSDAPGKLDYTINWQLSGIKVKNNLSVQVLHRTQGAMDISAFPLHSDDYKHFFPWLDISTWVKPVMIEQSLLLETGRYDIITFDEQTWIWQDDFFTPDTGGMSLVCLKMYKASKDDWTRSKNDKDWLYTGAGMLVQQTAPGLYRRAGQFSSKIFANNIVLSDETNEARETSSEAKWQWRTMRLV